MEDALGELARYTALGVKAIAVILIAFGVLEALILTDGQVAGIFTHDQGWRRNFFSRFAR